ncbi:MAG TPA: multicopper oxidase family protein [Terriglobales bacterium]|nr:multicopper oxidase family protein [Terriglobales bacterium]
MKNATSKTQLFLTLIVAVALFLAPAAFAAAPGITSTAGAAGTFSLTAQEAYLNQPDGNAVYSWGYGCVSGSAPVFVPAATFAFTPTCNTMQVPGPTMVVTEGQTVTINLTNNLPTPVGNTSILFPGFTLTSTCPNTAANPQGLLACEAAPGATVTYTFVASEAGTHPYYSGTQGDLQIEMGLYGAIVVMPATVPSNCANDTAKTNLFGQMDYGTTNHIVGFPEQDFRLANASGQKGAAYDHPKSCYDREYLFQWAEMDSRIHKQALAQVQAKVGCTAGTMGCSLDVQTEPYHPAYFLINGRSMPDLMDPNYASEYPHQPYNGNPHMHPGELTLIRTIGQGRWQHPFHEHANHVRILSRDGGLILSPTNPLESLSGILMFNTDTTPGESFDGIFYYSGRGLNWDAFGHHPALSKLQAPLPITAIRESGSTVTVTVSGTFADTPGANVIIAGAPAGYNGTFAIVSVNPSAISSTFTYTDSTTGLTSGASGTALATTQSNFAITAISESGNTVTATVTGILPFLTTPNSTVVIAGEPTGYNGSFTVNSVTNGTTTSTFTYADPTAGLLPGTRGTLTVNLGPAAAQLFPTDPLASLSCVPDANGYNTENTAALNYYEWCQDHNKPVQVNPYGDVGTGGPATFPDPDVFTNGAWYGGTPYFGPDATLRASHAACDTTANANCTDLNPSNVQANPATERGWAFMWHSHNEREITTNNVFPGGMLMMMLVDSREFAIDESN